MTPQQPFGISHAFSQGPGAMLGHEPLLTPALSPLRGEGVFKPGYGIMQASDDRLFTWVQSNVFSIQKPALFCYRHDFLHNAKNLAGHYWD